MAAAADLSAGALISEAVMQSMAQDAHELAPINWKVGERMEYRISMAFVGQVGTMTN